MNCRELERKKEKDGDNDDSLILYWSCFISFLVLFFVFCLEYSFGYFHLYILFVCVVIWAKMTFIIHFFSSIQGFILIYTVKTEHISSIWNFQNRKKKSQTNTAIYLWSMILIQTLNLIFVFVFWNIYIFFSRKKYDPGAHHMHQKKITKETDNLFEASKKKKTKNKINEWPFLMMITFSWSSCWWWWWWWLWWWRIC